MTPVAIFETYGFEQGQGSCSIFFVKKEENMYLYIEKEYLYTIILITIMLVCIHAVIIKDIWRALTSINDKLSWIENYLMESRKRELKEE